MGTRCVLTFLNHPTRGVSLPMDLRVNGALTFPVNSVDNGECRRARLPWLDSHGCGLSLLLLEAKSKRPGTGPGLSGAFVIEDYSSKRSSAAASAWPA